MAACPSCGTEEPAGARFCGTCGASLAAGEASGPAASPVTACPRCGSEEPVGAQFCGTCGASMGSDGEPVDPEPAPIPEAPTEVAPPRRRRRLPTGVLVAAVALLAAGAALGALFGTGVLAGDSGMSESAFVTRVNDNVLRPLGEADRTAADVGRAVDAVVATADGRRIVDAADRGSAYLRGLESLSSTQTEQVQVLLAVLGVNRVYGQTLSAFVPGDEAAQLALDSATATARDTLAAAAARLDANLELPSRETIVSAAPAPATTSTSTTTTAATAGSTAYVQQVDGLLAQSHGVVLAVRAFVRRATSGALAWSTAVRLARSYSDSRRLELNQARALAVPPEFEQAQQLLVRALQTSLADDQALVAWAVARRDGTGGARAAFARANRLGTSATALKRSFLAVYGPQRRAATGLSSASLPKDF
jgi:hypothetical protein